MAWQDNPEYVIAQALDVSITNALQRTADLATQERAFQIQYTTDLNMLEFYAQINIEELRLAVVKNKLTTEKILSEIVKGYCNQELALAVLEHPNATQEIQDLTKNEWLRHTWCPPTI